ncbi:hypothetical protein V1227_06385 [Lentzea sp. DG1S-22]|uniref:hypothetical protein n=1 Tax=Lentzea sp. DG1S-22 TaxID=3108822 RepID=UPI002E793242|nr:hypothetical protein [Lentzea sp. DG1S-22]WVH82380.1 hypothetical protein V1227_06385 [Lentzea sp. DG1S-22]
MRRDPARLPMRYLDSQGPRTPTREAWARDLVHPAGTKARTIARTPRDVLAGGASRRETAYAREAAMAARTSNGASAGDWRRFGERYGVLADQAAACTPAPAHRTPPLLIAHALATASTYRRQHLVRLSHEAQHDVSARLTLRDLSCSPAAVSAYHRDLVVMRHRARACLAELGSPGPFTALLHGDLDFFLRRASVWTREVLGATHGR